MKKNKSFKGMRNACCFSELYRNKLNTDHSDLGFIDFLNSIPFKISTI
jgi:hypothetical protein